MSFKTKVFTTAVTQPAVVSNFSLDIDGLMETSILAESATFPSDKLGKVALFYGGLPIYFPTKHQTPEIWSCSSVEDVFGEMYAEIFAKRVDQEMPSFTWEGHQIKRFQTFDIKVASYAPINLDYLSNLLLPSQTKSKLLQAAESLNDKVSTFKTQISNSMSIGNNPYSITGGGNIITYSCILRNAWIQDIEPLSLNAATPETAVKWKVNFVYDFIDNVYFNKIAFMLRKM